MNQRNQMIFLKDESGIFRLRNDISSCYYVDKQRRYSIRFSKGEKSYLYLPSNVDIAQFSRQLEPPFRIIRREDGEILHKVMGVSLYQGTHTIGYRVVFESGTIKDYSSDYLQIEEHISDHNSINVWDYLKEIAKYNRIPVDEDKTVSLADKYEKISFVEKNSILEAYLNKNKYGVHSQKQSAPIFPFGCNRSQYKAVRNALENRLSVIQGPPGTGKTQTILNIAANLFLCGKTMQIVSNNNSAVSNVQEKLQTLGLDFLCAQLGRSSNKMDFISNQSGLYPDMSSWRVDNSNSLRQEAVLLSRELQQLYEIQEKLAISSEKLSEYKLQIERYPKQQVVENHCSTKRLEKFLLIVNREFSIKHHLSWWTRFRLNFHRLPSDEDALDQLQYLFFTAKINELEKECKQYSEFIKNIDTQNDKLIKISMCVLKDFLSRQYNNNNERKVFSLDEIVRKTPVFLQEYPIVLSTTFSATSNINSSYKFDYIIIDESSQVDIAAGALALSCARNAVVVGDLKQLPNVVDSNTYEIANSIFEKYNIAESYRYTTNSFLSSICRLYHNIPQTLLKEHYRCDPLIIGFCSKRFYDGELIPMKKSQNDYPPIRVIHTVEGNHARGTVNLRQVAVVTQEIIPEIEKHYHDIGIIAPYNNQVNELRSALQNAGRDYVAATVHKFQGRENDAIILSTVDNQIREFTDDPHLLNVAVSRAKKQFTLVVSSDEQPDSNIQELINYIEYYQGETIKSKITSIFDLLYKDYTQELLNFYKTHSKVSEYDSENLAYWIILETIKEEGYSNLGLLMHYPLRHLISPSSDLTPEQRKYASHPWTHIDFLIYDTITHKAKLALEIDGTQYHRVGSAQSKRDEMKDSILDTIGLLHDRFKTNDSQEKEKLKKLLS
jgi:superfamily I DNA and/or RNA helicase